MRSMELLILFLLSTAIRPTLSSLATPHSIITRSCSATRYPKLCHSAILTAPYSAAEISKISTPKHVILLSLNLTTTAVQNNHFTVERLIKQRQDLTSREKNALRDCLETIGGTLDELHLAISDLEEYPSLRKSVHDHADDLKTLMSAAMTNQDTCLDGFSHAQADRRVREALEGGQVHVERMCSNALAMIKNMTDTDIALAEATEGRKLKQKEHVWPKWLSGEDRRLLRGTDSSAADAVVAADGSGDYRTVQEAVEAAPEKSERRYVIKIKAGVYKENVEVKRKKSNIMFVGEGRNKTIIQGSKNVVDGSTTFHSATVAINGNRFLARDMAFENTAGPSKEQAVALRVSGDLSAFYRCAFLGYQDTLYVHRNRQFFVNCYVSGTIDFIFGNSAAVFQDCDIHARKPNHNQKNMFTAHGRTDPNQNTGIVLHKCRIDGTAELRAEKGRFLNYLGRPWKEYSRTVVMRSRISGLIHPAGWHEWYGEFGLQTLYFGEYNNTGPGADTSKRVGWKGFRVISSVDEARGFTPGRLIAGDSWLGSTGFPFSFDL